MTEGNLRMLRKKLDDLTPSVAVEQQPQYVANLAQEFSHSIKLVPPDDPRHPSSNRFNCFAYSLNLADSTEWARIASIYRSIHADSNCVIFLREKHLLEEVTSGEATDADIILYFDSSKPVHAGKLYSGKVTSKWGPDGLLWEHPIFEVPEKYGDETAWFKVIGKHAATAAFLDYAESRGANRQLVASLRRRLTLR